MAKKIILFIVFLFYLFSINNNNKLGAQEKNFVSLIHAYYDELESWVLVSWETIDNPRAVYKIYRLEESIKSKNFTPLQSSLIKTVDYNVNQIVDVPPRTGKYYYLVTVVLEDKEWNMVLPDQNYTFQPVDFYQPAGIVRNIKAKFMPQKSENWIQWDHPDSGEKVKSYTIYRSMEPILKNNLEKAEKVGEIPADKNFYYDKVKNQGNYYYAVLSHSIYNFPNYSLIEGMNTLAKPALVVSLDSKKLPDFYLVFPVDITFDFKINPIKDDIPDKLRIIPMEPYKIYGEERKKEVQKNQEEKNIPEKLVEEKNTGIETEKISKTEFEKELLMIRLLFENAYQKKKFQEFQKQADNIEKKLKSQYVKAKLTLYRAFIFYKMQEYKKAKLMIETLKSDKKFLKYNENKIKELEKILQDK